MSKQNRVAINRSKLKGLISLSESDLRNIASTKSDVKLSQKADEVSISIGHNHYLNYLRISSSSDSSEYSEYTLDIVASTTTQKIYGFTVCELKELLKKISKKLKKKYDIPLDFTDSYFSYIEIQKTFISQYSFSDYKEPFCTIAKALGREIVLCGGPSEKKDNYLQIDHPKNNVEIVFYDKSYELKKRKNIVTEPNTLRIEFGDALPTAWTLNKLYTAWHSDFKLLVEQDHSSIDTLTRYEALYKKHMAVESDFINADVEKLKLSEFKAFLARRTAHRNISRKELNNLKSLLNHLYDYGIEHDLQLVPVRALSTKDLMCKLPDTEGAVYTDAERLAVITAASLEKNQIYARAIQIHFHLCARVGEIKALKWSDIDFNTGSIRIAAEVVPKLVDGEIIEVRVEYTKSKKESGKRTLQLSPDALEILKKHRSEFPFSEYVFQYGGSFLTTDQYNKVLKRICNQANVRYLSSHKLRFWAVTAMFESGMDPYDIQRAAGHASLQMTEHYNRTSNSKVIEMKIG